MVFRKKKVVYGPPISLRIRDDDYIEVVNKAFDKGKSTSEYLREVIRKDLYGEEGVKDTRGDEYL